MSTKERESNPETGEPVSSAEMLYATARALVAIAHRMHPRDEVRWWGSLGSTTAQRAGNVGDAQAKPLALAQGTLMGPSWFVCLVDRVLTRQLANEIRAWPGERARTPAREHTATQIIQAMMDTSPGMAAVEAVWRMGGAHAVNELVERTLGPLPCPAPSAAWRPAPTVRPPPQAIVAREQPRYIVGVDWAIIDDPDSTERG